MGPVRHCDEDRPHHNVLIHPGYTCDYAGYSKQRAVSFALRKALHSLDLLFTHDEQGEFAVY